MRAVIDLEILYFTKLNIGKGFGSHALVEENKSTFATTTRWCLMSSLGLIMFGQHVVKVRFHTSDRFYDARVFHISRFGNTQKTLILLHKIWREVQQLVVRSKRSRTVICFAFQCGDMWILHQCWNNQECQLLSSSNHLFPARNLKNSDITGVSSSLKFLLTLHKPSILYWTKCFQVHVLETWWSAGSPDFKSLDFHYANSWKVKWIGLHCIIYRNSNEEHGQELDLSDKSLTAFAPS